MPRDGGLRGREGDAGLSGRALAADFEGEVGAEADALVRKEPGGGGDGLAVDEGAVLPRSSSRWWS